MWELLLIGVLILIWFWPQHEAVFGLDGRIYWVAIGFRDKQGAANVMANIVDDVLILLRHLQNRYLADKLPLDEMTDRQRIVWEILTRFNPDVIHENDPRRGSETSWIEDKGESLHLCIRHERGYGFVDLNTLVFVAIHEVAHIGAYDVWGHPPRFWQVFKFLLQEAVEVGVWVPHNYTEKPVEYCGMMIDYSPYHDESIVAA